MNFVGVDPWLIHSLPEANLRVATTEIKVDNARKQLMVDVDLRPGRIPARGGGHL